MAIPLDKLGTLRKYLAEQIITQCIALDQIEGVATRRVAGCNPDVDPGTSPETIWMAGGLHAYPAAGFQAEVLSDNVNDAAAGTGARTILIEGVDTNWDYQTELVIMNGTTAVTTTRTDWLRINKGTVITAGATLLNEGTMVIQIAGGGNVQRTFIAERGITVDAIFSTHNEISVCVTSVSFGATTLLSQTAVEVGIFVRDTDVVDGAFTQEWGHSVRGGGTSSAHFPLLQASIVVPPRHDVEMRIIRVDANNNAVTGSMDFIEFDQAIISPAP